MNRILITAGICVAAILTGWACPATFQVQDDITANKTAEICANDTTANKAYVDVQEQAEFPGGLQGLMEWLGKTLKYPKNAFQNNIQGRVMLKFIIEKDGKVTNVEILEHADPDLDKEALRVARKMPKWIPAKLNGEPVRSYFTFPVNFRLQTK